MILKILLYQQHEPLLPCLQAILSAIKGFQAHIFCLCADAAIAQAVEAEYKDHGPYNIKFQTFTIDHFSSFTQLANHLFLEDEVPESSLIFFCSSNVLLNGDFIQPILEEFQTYPEISGVNPLLLTGWNNKNTARIAFMGLVADSQKMLHYLYEGYPADSLLIQKKRFFQFAHPGALMLRQTDFMAVGGFQENLGPLSVHAFCLHMLKIKKKGFSCLPTAYGRLLYMLDSWDFCGIWNSILQRGRLDARDIKSDYPAFCLEDGLGYRADAWLAEGPAEMPVPEPDDPDRYWLRWQYHPSPPSMLECIASLPEQLKQKGVELARNRPSSLPKSLQYYRVQADKILSFAKAYEMADLESDILNWQGKIRRFHYGELRRGMELLKTAGIYNCSLDSCPAIYDAWIETRESFRKIDAGKSWPEIAVVMPVWNPRHEFFIQAIESVRAQSYSRWQLCIADDASTDREIRFILENFRSQDPRIRVTFREENGHICRATNSALALVSAPFTAFMDQDDLLSQDALSEIAALLVEKPQLGFIFSDDDRINEWNVRRNPVFKPDYDSDLLFTYTGHLAAYSTQILKIADGLRIGTEGSQDLDLLLRVEEMLEPDQIAHIPKILYHWRVHEDSTAGSLLAKPYVIEATRRALLDAAARRNLNAAYLETEKNRFFRLLYEPPAGCQCSLILLQNEISPSRKLLNCLEPIFNFADVETLVQPIKQNACLPKLGPSWKAKKLPFEGENIANACNFAAQNASGEILLFISSDLEPRDACRPEQMIARALLPNAALTGASFWAGNILVNGGWYPDLTGRPFPLLSGMDHSEIANSCWGQFLLPRHALGCSMKCMATRKSVFKNLGLFDPDFGPLAAIDFGMRAMRHKLNIIIHPLCNWMERKRQLQYELLDMQKIQDKWGAEIAVNGLRNPNLRKAQDDDWTLIL